MAGTDSNEGILEKAIAGTEQEVADAAWNDNEPVETEADTDTSLEETEDDVQSEVENDGKDEAESEAGDDEAGDADADAQGGKPGEQQTRDKAGKFTTEGEKPEGGERADATGERRGNTAIPLREERQKRQVLETELEKERRERAAERETFQTKFAQLEGRLDQVTRGQPPVPKVDQSKTEEAKGPPDIFTDPEGYNKWVEDQVSQRVSTAIRGVDDRLINSSLAAAHEQHGEKFDAAYKSLTSLDPNNPAHRAVVASIRTAPNPGAKLMQWHRQQETLREVGSDPTAYRQKVAEETKAALLKDPEFRKQLLDEMKAEAGGDQGNGNGRPRTIIRKLPSLNGSGGRSERSQDVGDADGSERAMAESVWKD